MKMTMTMLPSLTSFVALPQAKTKYMSVLEAQSYAILVWTQVWERTVW